MTLNLLPKYSDKSLIVMMSRLHELRRAELGKVPSTVWAKSHPFDSKRMRIPHTCVYYSLNEIYAEVDRRCGKK